MPSEKLWYFLSSVAEFSILSNKINSHKISKGTLKYLGMSFFLPPGSGLATPDIDEQKTYLLMLIWLDKFNPKLFSETQKVLIIKEYIFLLSCV